MHNLHLEFILAHQQAFSAGALGSGKGGEGREPVLPEIFYGGVWQVFGILILFLTKICDFRYLISDLTQTSYPISEMTSANQE